MNPDKWFDEFVRGKYKISNGLSSAKFWSGVRDPSDTVGKGVPRPDIDIGWLTVAALFSLDHLFLRSPGTGFLKVITFGGLGLWWLWDLVQLFGEKERVLKYGMSAPFDFWTGIGQGMIYDGATLNGEKWQYEQKYSMGLWMMTMLIGFTGVDWIYLGKTWQGLRRLVYFVLAMSFISVLAVSISKGIDGDGLVGFIISISLLIVILLPAFGIWVSNIKDLLASPEEVFNTEGLKNPGVVVGMVGWPQRIYTGNQGNIIGSKEWLAQEGVNASEEEKQKAEISFSRWKRIKEYFMINKAGITSKELKGFFSINYKSQAAKPQQPAQSGGAHRGGAHHDSHQSTQSYTSRGGSIRSPMEQGAIKRLSSSLDQSNPLRGQANQNVDEDVAGIPPLDLAWQMGEIVYDQVSSIAYGILDAVAMTTPWGAAAKTAQLALKAAAKQGGIQLPSALTKGNPMAALRGLASSASQGIGSVVKEAGAGALSSVGESASERLSSALTQSNPLVAAVAQKAAKAAKVVSDPKGLAGIAAKVVSDPKGLAGIAASAAKVTGVSLDPKGLAGVAAKVAGDPKGLAGVAGSAVASAAKVASDPKGLAGVAAKVVSDPKGLAGTPAKVASDPKGLAGVAAKVAGPAVSPQKGGGQAELSTEAQILGASVIAIISGGTLKTLIDFLMSD